MVGGLGGQRPRVDGGLSEILDQAKATAAQSKANMQMPPAQQPEGPGAVPSSFLGRVKSWLSRTAEQPAATTNQVAQAAIAKTETTPPKPMTAHKVVAGKSMGDSIKAAFSKLGDKISAALHDAKMNLAYTFTLSKDQRIIVDLLRDHSSSDFPVATKYDNIQKGLERDLKTGAFIDLATDHLPLLNQRCGVEFTNGLIAHLASKQPSRADEWVRVLSDSFLSKSTGANLDAIATRVVRDPAIPNDRKVAVFAFRAQEFCKAQGKGRDPLLSALMKNIPPFDKLEIGLSEHTGVDLSKVALSVGGNLRIPNDKMMAVFAFKAEEHCKAQGKAKEFQAALADLMPKDSKEDVQRRILNDIREYTAKDKNGDFSTAASIITPEGIKQESDLFINNFDLIKILFDQEKIDNLKLERLYVGLLAKENSDPAALKTVLEQLKSDYPKAEDRKAIVELMKNPRITEAFTGLLQGSSSTRKTVEEMLA